MPADKLPYPVLPYRWPPSIPSTLFNVLLEKSAYSEIQGLRWMRPSHAMSETDSQDIRSILSASFLSWSIVSLGLGQHLALRLWRLENSYLLTDVHTGHDGKVALPLRRTIHPNIQTNVNVADKNVPSSHAHNSNWRWANCKRGSKGSGKSGSRGCCKDGCEGGS
jgi:hypothetical protein